VLVVIVTFAFMVVVIVMFATLLLHRDEVNGDLFRLSVLGRGVQDERQAELLADKRAERNELCQRVEVEVGRFAEDNLVTRRVEGDVLDPRAKTFVNRCKLEG